MMGRVIHSLKSVQMYSKCAWSPAFLLFA